MSVEQFLDYLAAYPQTLRLASELTLIVEEEHRAAAAVAAERRSA